MVLFSIVTVSVLRSPRMLHIVQTLQVKLHVRHVEDDEKVEKNCSISLEL